MPLHRVPIDDLDRTVIELERTGQEVVSFAVHADDALILTRARTVRRTVAAREYGAPQ